jgi:NAD(P)-dependent dehydrogenase (short-subunit alcohol dehydrogenase family)
MPAPIRPAFIVTTHHDIYDAINPRTTLANKVHGKTVLITGAGRGIGRSIAIAFAHAGANRLILTARTISQLDAVANEVAVVSNNIEVIRIRTDVTDESQVAALFDAIQGNVHILINNAGIVESCRHLLEADTNEWWSTWEVNVKGVYLLTSYFLRKYGSIGTIINMSSMSSIRTTPGFSAYQPGKTAINRITDFIHAENPNVRVFAFHPGGVKTELARKLPENVQQYLIDTPELAAGYCVWLATEPADFLRGRYSDCTWDVNELMNNAQLIVDNDLFKQVIKMG